MVNIEDAVTAKLSMQGLNFEILVDCEKALELKHGKDIPVEDVVVSGLTVFKDVKKGEKANEHEIQRLFFYLK